MSPGEAPRGARPRGWLANLALAAVATLFALCCAEVGLRVADRLRPPPPAPAPPDPSVAALPELRSLIELTQPNVVGRFQGLVWRTNSAGFRGPETSPVPAAGTYRIAVVGDSFVAAVSMSESETYTGQLERLLAASGASRFEVLNFGLPGLDATYVLDRTELLASQFHPSLYVYGYTLNDVFRFGEDQVTPAADPAAVREFFEATQRIPSRVVLELLRGVSSLRAAYTPNEYVQLVVKSYRDPKMLARIHKAFARLAALAAEQGVCAHVLIHTDVAALRLGHPFVDTYAVIESAAREAGLTATVTWPAFRWRDSTRLRVSMADAHPSAAGNRILAESLYDALRALPPRCGVPALPARGDS